MRALKLLGLLGLVVSLTVACGKSDEQKAAEKAAEEAKEAAEALKKAAETGGAAAAAKGMQEFAKAMESAAAAMGRKSADGKPVEPVSFQELQSALPEVSGWQRATPTGERMTSPIAYSQAEADYTMGDASINVKMVDSAFSQLLIAPWRCSSRPATKSRQATATRNRSTSAATPASRSWNKGSKDGEINLVIANRFLVTVDGDNIGDSKVLHEFASKIDAGKLAALK